MSKCKELVLVACLVVITSLMWLVSSCSQLAESSVPIKPPYVINSTSVKSSQITTQPHILSSPTPTESSITPGPPIAGNSATAESSTTSAVPATTESSPPSESLIPSSSFVGIDINDYRLVISGLVNTPLSLSYEQIQSYATITENVEIICPGVEDETDEWTGVPISTLLKEAGIQNGASEIVFTGADGYSTQLPLELVQQSGVFLAYLVDGQTFQARGYPIRLVVSGTWGAAWVRLLTNIEVKSDTVSLKNSSPIIQNLRNNISISGRKLCSCLLSGVKGFTNTVN